MDYSYKDYWHALHRRSGLSAVGQSGLPDRLNDWIYRSIARNLRRFAQRHRLSAPPGGRLLEVGVGTGYWVPFWQHLGWRVDGCDLVADAVERLRDRHPDGTFWRADVSSEDGVLASSDDLAAEGYDLVTATSVLLHVTEDGAFDRALANVAAAVRPGGHLLLVEPVLTQREQQPAYDPAKASRARVLRSYVRPLHWHGLKLEAVEATTVLAANPLEANTKRRLERYGAWWKLVARSRERPSMARWLGPTMYVMDGLLMRTEEAPTSKVMLFHRPT